MSIDSIAPASGASSVVPFPKSFAPDDYRAQQAAQIKELLDWKLAGNPLTLDMVVCMLDFAKDNSYTRAWAVESKLCTASEFNKELHKQRVQQRFGCVPQNASHLVTIVAEQDGLAPDYQGLIRRPPARTYTLAGKTYSVDDSQITSADVEAMVRMCHKTELTLSELALDLRLLRDEYRLQIENGAIADAIQKWQERAKQEHFAQIGINVAASPLNRPLPQYVAKADALWMDLAQGCFDLSQHSAAYVIAVQKKFIWQVKRKMRGQDVTNHLMPVFLGPQGAGKSTYIRALCGPVKELLADTDFAAIEEARNIQLWDNFVLFLDEMGHASKSDVDVIKHAISADTLSRRPMGTNRMEIVKQRATFIGGSNKELAQLIKDPTGLRRFAGLRFLSKSNWELTNKADWGLLWQTVDQMGADPMDAHRDEMKLLQDQDRETGRVETWLRMADLGYIARKHGDNGRILATNLYGQFQEWEQDFFKSGMAISLTEFGHEMRRLIENHPDVVPFRRKRANKGTVYSFIDLNAASDQPSDEE